MQTKYNSVEYIAVQYSMLQLDYQNAFKLKRNATLHRNLCTSKPVLQCTNAMQCSTLLYYTLQSRIETMTTQGKAIKCTQLALRKLNFIWSFKNTALALPGH